ncbi:MAG: hypothetical protein JJE35_05885 [Thermoleophilia bacterium]|nr:hypothetical protein [Thermoleophilia bacterium]
MSTVSLASSPNIPLLYARAAAPLIPGASLLPFVPGGGGEIPELELELAGVKADAADVAAYARVCGFALRDKLPPTYPHLLAFPLQMAVMADGSFPFGAIGLIHLENRIAQLRPLGISEELILRVRPTKLLPHPKGRTFTLVTEVRTGNKLAWESVSTMLRRGGDGSGAVVPGKRGQLRPSAENFATVPTDTPASAEWRLDGGLGRRYAAVSGDRNPIHMHALAAKPLGFSAAIAHGMWTKARCLAALESRLPDAFAVDVRFRKPILLPSRVEFASAEIDDSASDGDIAFTVRDAKRGVPHLDGLIRPSETKQAKTGRKK